MMRAWTVVALLVLLSGCAAPAPPPPVVSPYAHVNSSRAYAQAPARPNGYSAAHALAAAARTAVHVV